MKAVGWDERKRRMRKSGQRKFYILPTVISDCEESILFPLFFSSMLLIKQQHFSHLEFPWATNVRQVSLGANKAINDNADVG